MKKERGKRISIIIPRYLEILDDFPNRKFTGICPNMDCNFRFTFTTDFVLEKLQPHIKECLKRKEKRGAYKWIKHICLSCEKVFQWDIPIYMTVTPDQLLFRFELHTKKYRGPLDNFNSSSISRPKPNGH